MYQTFITACVYKITSSYNIGGKKSEKSLDKAGSLLMWQIMALNVLTVP